MKWFSVIVLSGLTVLVFSSCDGKEADATSQGQAAAAGEEEGEGCLGDCEGDQPVPPDMTAAVTKDDPSGVYGAGIQLTDFTKISEILAKPEEFEGKRVLVQGEAVGVCTKRGCWVDIKGDEPFAKIQVKVDDGVIVFPATCIGKKVVAEGTVEKLTIPEERHKEIMKARAEKKGEEFDPASVSGPMIVWRIHGVGARIES